MRSPRGNENIAGVFRDVRDKNAGASDEHSRRSFENSAIGSNGLADPSYPSFALIVRNGDEEIDSCRFILFFVQASHVDVIDAAGSRTTTLGAH